MGRRVVITQAQVIRNVQAVEKAGLQVCAIEFAPDGTLRIVTAAVDSGPQPDKDDRKPEPWT